jgi:hypothetical protein
MNRKISEILSHLAIKNHFSVYSAIFRIFICFHLLKDLYFYWEYIPILYSDSSFYTSQPTFFLELFGIRTEVVRDNFNFFIFVYLAVIFLFSLGVGRNLTAFLLFICVEIIQRLCYVVLNGGDNLLKFCIMYMVFIDSFNYFILQKKVQTNRETYKNFISNLGCYAICIHLCIVYFFSAIHKIHADVWFNGIATYYTLSSERFNGTPWNYQLAKNGFIVTISSYLTLLIEMAYPFLVWFRETKKIMVLAALFLHISIYILMMIYDFQIVFIAVQGFFINDSWWKRICLKFQNKLPKWLKS